MAQDVDGFKATAEEILRSDLSDGAKLAAMAEAMGAKTTAEVAVMLKKSTRSIERYQAELRTFVRQPCPTDLSVNQDCPTDLSDRFVGTTQICPTDLSVSRVEYNNINNTNQEVIYNNITPLTPQPLKTTPSKRGSRLPDDWQLPDDWRAWTEVNCPATTPERIAREAIIFANFWQAKPGAQACKLDWKKTWQNWCLKAFATAPTRPTSQGVFKSAAERQLDRSRESRAIIERMIAGSAVQ